MTIEHLKSKIGGVTGIPWSIAEGNRRTPSVVRARWIMLYALQHYCPWMSLQEMAEVICRECHGTVMHGIRKANKLYEHDQNFKAQVDAVLERE